MDSTWMVPGILLGLLLGLRVDDAGGAEGAVERGVRQAVLLGQLLADLGEADLARLLGFLVLEMTGQRHAVGHGPMVVPDCVKRLPQRQVRPIVHGSRSSRGSGAPRSSGQ